MSVRFLGSLVQKKVNFNLKSIIRLAKQKKFSREKILLWSCIQKSKKEGCTVFSREIRKKEPYMYFFGIHLPVYINKLNQQKKFCKINQFVGDTNLLCLSNSTKALNKLVNADLKHLVNCLNVHKTSLNVK